MYLRGCVCYASGFASGKKQEGLKRFASWRDNMERQKKNIYITRTEGKGERGKYVGTP